MSDSFDPMDYSPWNSLGWNTGVGSLSCLQGLVPTQGSNPGIPHCRQILYQLSQGQHLRHDEIVNLRVWNIDVGRFLKGFPSDYDSKESTCNAGDLA